MRNLRAVSSYKISIQAGSRPVGGITNLAEGIPSLSAEHMDNFGNVIVDKMKFIPREFFDKTTRGKIQKGDVLVVKDGATTGKSAVIDDSFPFEHAMVNEHTFILRTEGDLDPKFLYLFLRSKEPRRFFESARNHGHIGGLRQEFIDLLMIPEFDLPEQKRIIQRYELLREAIREATFNCAQISDLSLKLKQSMITNVLTPHFAKNRPLGQFLSVQPQNGWSPPAEFQTGSGTPVLTLSSVTGYEFKPDEVTLSSAPVNPEGRYWISSGDLLITRSNTPGLVGHSALVPELEEEFIYCDLIMRMRVNESLADPKFAHFVLQSAPVRQFISIRQKGQSGTMKKISKADVQQIPFPDITLKDQMRLLDLIKETSGPIEELLTNNRSRLSDLENLESSLIDEIFDTEFQIQATA
jgi:type I restriction enzyme S subunit